MNPYRDFVSQYADLAGKGTGWPLGHFPQCRARTAVPGFTFATLYRLRRWRNGNFETSWSKAVPFRKPTASRNCSPDSSWPPT